MPRILICREEEERYHEEEVQIAIALKMIYDPKLESTLTTLQNDTPVPPGVGESAVIDTYVHSCRYG